MSIVSDTWEGFVGSLETTALPPVMLVSSKRATSAGTETSRFEKTVLALKAKALSLSFGMVGNSTLSHFKNCFRLLPDTLMLPTKRAAMSLTLPSSVMVPFASTVVSPGSNAERLRNSNPPLATELTFTRTFRNISCWNFTCVIPKSKTRSTSFNKFIS